MDEFIFERKNKKIPKMLYYLVNFLEANDWKVYLVGGGVIDLLENRVPKDWDLELHGYGAHFTLDALDTNLKWIKYLTTTKEVGKQFGIIKGTFSDGVEVDFALPRSEKKIGGKHTDFEVTTLRHPSIAVAAKRRDLTINAIYYRIVNNEFIDPYGGINDLKAGLLRHVDDETFSEDPLRVLRIMQLLPRKGRLVAQETLELCQQLYIEDTHKTISKERIDIEFRKLLLMSGPRIRDGFNFLMESFWISLFPELHPLIHTPQDHEHHPEGHVWEHTMRCVEQAVKIRDEVPESLQYTFMLAVLMHDLGKVTTLQERTIGKNSGMPRRALTNYGHEVVSEILAEQCLRRFTDNEDIIGKVKNLVREHGRVYAILNWGKKNQGSAVAWRRLYNDIHAGIHDGSEMLTLLGYVIKCDILGSSKGIAIEAEHYLALCKEWQGKLHDKDSGMAGKIKPILSGKFLIKHKIAPGPEMGIILKACYEIQINSEQEDLTPDEIWVLYKQAEVSKMV